MLRKALLIVLLVSASTGSAWAGDIAATADGYLKPYVDSNNFSGAVRIERAGRVLFQRAYGLADGQRRRNTVDTMFHVASVSAQFTAAAVLRLVDQKRLSLDERIAQIVPGVPDGERITVRELLEETSGLPDINALPDYDSMLSRHQTPETLVDRIRGLHPVREPGEKQAGEEHSAYNLLALIVERRTGEPFRRAVHELVFRPAGMLHSGIDDDTPIVGALAIGFLPVGQRDLAPATVIHWSGKTGNGSAYTTALDLARWVRLTFGESFFSPSTRQLIMSLDGPHSGYGWFRVRSPQVGAPLYFMNGLAPGFAAYVMYWPQGELTVVVLSNLYEANATTIGVNLAAIALGKPYKPFLIEPVTARPDAAGIYLFGAHFYQPNARLQVLVTSEGASIRWPSGDVAALLPTGTDKFVDRHYWTPVDVIRGAESQVVALDYDGRRGVRQLDSH